MGIKVRVKGSVGLGFRVGEEKKIFLKTKREFAKKHNCRMNGTVTREIVIAKNKQIEFDTVPNRIWNRACQKSCRHGEAHVVEWLQRLCIPVS